VIALGLLLLAAPADEGWQEAGRRDGVVVYTKSRTGTPFHEAMAAREVATTPERCVRVVDDLASFPQWMPYLAEARVLSPGVVYHRVRAPLVAERDYIIRFVDDSKDGVLRRSWKAEPTTLPLRAGVVRVTQTEGAWVFEPRGDKTLIRYVMFSDPGGSVPAWLANFAATAMLPDVVNAVAARCQSP
jgi:uncharacterized membrane protein